MDAEWGIGMRLDDGFSFPYNMTLGAIENDSLIYQVGKRIGFHAKRLGVQINFAPVVDINTNPANPIIGFRSFGYANDLQWIPKVRLPSVVTGITPVRRSRASKRTLRRRHLKSVSEIKANSAEREIDKILDQVAESGINSLSKGQRKKLEEHSKNLRKKRED